MPSGVACALASGDCAPSSIFQVLARRHLRNDVDE